MAASNTGTLEQLSPLEGRIEELRTRAGAAEALLAEIKVSVDELVSLPGADPALGELVEELSARIDALGDRVEGMPVDTALETIQARTSSLETKTGALAERVADLADAGGVDALQAAVAELQARPSGDPALASRVQSIAEELEQLTGRLQGIADTSETLRFRLDGLADLEALADLRTTLDELAARPTSDAELIARVDALAARLDTRAATDEIEALRADVAALAERSGGDPAHATRLDELATALQALTARLESVTDVHAELESMRGNIATLAERPAGDPAHAVRLDEIAHRLAELDARLAELERAESQTEVGDGSALESRLDELARVVTELASDLEGTVALQAALEARVDAAPGSRAVKPRAPGDATQAPAGVEGELDRMLMAIERLSLRIGEHDRALKELVKMQHAAARAGALPAPRSSGEGADPVAEDGDLRAEVRGLSFRLTEAEEALRSDRDKAFSQIERVASSITWRLQRLEEQSGAPAQPGESG
jgi:DNA repair exonuclease SbcCD ATPase subunit